MSEKTESETHTLLVELRFRRRVTAEQAEAIALNGLWAYSSAGQFYPTIGVKSYESD